MASNRQKLGALQADDKTVVADASIDPNYDKYDGPPETTEEARKARLARGRTGSGGLSGQRFGNGLGRMCDAQAYCDREAAKDIVNREVERGIALMPRDRIKQRNVMRELEVHFKTVSITSHAIKRMVRIKTDKLYTSSIYHMYKCKSHARCEARLWELHSSAIALVCLQHEVDRLVNLFDANDQHNDVENIDKQCLKDVQSKIKRSTFFNNLIPSSQLVSCIHSIKLLDAPGFDPAISCNDDQGRRNEGTVHAEAPAALGCERPVLHGSKEAPLSAISSQQAVQPQQATTASSSTTARSLVTTKDTLVNSFPSMSGIKRCVSLCSNGTESPGPTSKNIELRDAVISVFIAHRSELKMNIRDIALQAINLAVFQTAIQEDSTLASIDSSQLAFCLLNCIGILKATSSMLFTQSMNLGIASRLNIGIEKAELAIEAIRRAIPQNLIRGDDPGDDFKPCDVYEASENDLFS